MTTPRTILDRLLVANNAARQAAAVEGATRTAALIDRVCTLGLDLAAAMDAPVEPEPLVIDVPDTIDATGTTDVGQALTDWIATLEPGNTVRFREDGTYRIDDATVELPDLADTVLDFAGATLMRTRILDQPMRYPRNHPFLRLTNPTRVTVRNMLVRGIVTNEPGVMPATIVDQRGVARGVAVRTLDGAGAYCVSYEFEHGISLNGTVEDCIVEDCDLAGMGGDGVYIKGEGAHDITVRRVKIRRNGRQGIALCSGRDILIEDCDIVSSRGGIDIEPDTPTTLERIEIRNCTIASHLLAFPCGGAGPVHDVNIHHNTITSSGTPVLFVVNRRHERTGWQFADNVDTSTGRAGPFPAVRLDNVRDAVIARNTLPRRQGAGAGVGFWDTPSHDVAVYDNDFTGHSAIVEDRAGGSTWTESETP